MRRTINRTMSFLNFIIPKNRNMFVFFSFPEVADNSYGMFKYLFNKYQNDGTFVWLLYDTSSIDKHRAMIMQDLEIDLSEIEKVQFVKKSSVMGAYYFMRSKYVFGTHGFYHGVRFPKDHILVNLWHGMPLKTIGLLDSSNKGIPESTYTIATSSYYQSIMAKAFGMKEKNILLSGQPRNDLLFENKNCLKKIGINRMQYKKIILWTPTYRQSLTGDIRTDGAVSEGLPVLGTKFDELNDTLRSIDTVILVKLHPMDQLNAEEMVEYSNIKILKSNDLEDSNCQLYHLMNESDILLTDFSSIYIDYLLLDHPIAFVLDDFSAYEDSRGFVFDSPKEYMPGKFISSFSDLCNFIENLEEELVLDKYKEHRNKVNQVLNNVRENFSKILWNMILSNERNE